MDNKDDELYYLKRNIELHQLVERQEKIIMDIYESLSTCIKNDFRLDTLKELRISSKILCKYLDNNVDKKKKL